MATTIQLPMELKCELDTLKDNSRMSYAELLKKLVQNEKKRRNELLLIEYGLKYGDDSVKEVKKWESTEKEWDY